MDNTFFLTQDSFKNPNITLDQFDNIVSALSEQINKFKDIPGNSLKYCSDIFTTWQWNGQNVFELIWDPETDFDNDLRSKLQNIIQEKAIKDDTPSTSIEFKDISSSSSNCLLAEQENDSISKDHQITPDGLTWYEFTLKFIKRNPGDSDVFLSNCEILFQNIEFLPNARISIKSIYDDFKITILSHLDDLNQNIKTAKGPNETETLKKLSALCHFDEEPSLERDHSSKRKKQLTFDEVYCEPHIKLCHSDKYPGDSQYYFHRIYFNMNEIHSDSGKIQIGHIGKHL
jgi:hypothetical protein